MDTSRTEEDSNAGQLQTQSDLSIPNDSSIVFGDQKTIKFFPSNAISFRTSNPVISEDAKQLPNDDSIEPIDLSTQSIQSLEPLDFPFKSLDMKKYPNIEAFERGDGMVSLDEKSRKLPGYFANPPEPVTKRMLFSAAQDRLRSKILLIESQEQAREQGMEQMPVNFVEVTCPTKILDGRVICFDVETTGFSANDCIIEIGAAEYIMGQRTGVLFQSYIKPDVVVNQHAAAVHGITNHQLQNAPLAKFIIPSFLSWVGSSPLVAHNAKFDTRMLQRECERLNLQNLLEGKSIFCTMKYFRKKYPGLPYSLMDVYSYLLGTQNYISNIQLCNPKLPNHSAIVDTETLGEVFLQLCENVLSPAMSEDMST